MILLKDVEWRDPSEIQEDYARLATVVSVNNRVSSPNDAFLDLMLSLY